MRGLLRAITPDVVDGHFVTTYGFIAACGGFHPLVVTAWGSDVLIQPKGNLVYRFTSTYAIRRADAVVCLAPVLESQILTLGIDPGKIHVVVIGGVERGRFHASARDAGLMKRLAIGPDEPVVISTRSFAPVYDVRTLLKAAPIILLGLPTVKFIVAGRGEQEGQLRELATSLGILDSVRFVGWLEHEELPKYLSSSDVYVSTSLSDGTSNSLLEAMASELPPVVSDIPANRQWIQEAENGFLFPIGDHVALARRVIQLIADREMRTLFGHRSRKVVELNADPEVEMKKLDNIYSRLTSGKDSF
jgi:glycosyltransferase involved in cell wall biosynthesis